MNEIGHFKVFVICNDDVAADVDHLYVKRIYLVGFSYIVIEDNPTNLFSFLSPFFFVIAIFYLSSHNPSNHLMSLNFQFS
jgi:hypothetical protein